MDNDFLKNLDLSQVRELVESMYPRDYAKNSYLIREGEVGEYSATISIPLKSMLVQYSAHRVLYKKHLHITKYFNLTHF